MPSANPKFIKAWEATQGSQPHCRPRPRGFSTPSRLASVVDNKGPLKGCRIDPGRYHEVVGRFPAELSPRPMWADIQPRKPTLRAWPDDADRQCCEWWVHPKITAWVPCENEEGPVGPPRVTDPHSIVRGRHQSVSHESVTQQHNNTTHGHPTPRRLRTVHTNTKIMPGNYLLTICVLFHAGAQNPGRRGGGRNEGERGPVDRKQFGFRTDPFSWSCRPKPSI
jgi:hypothetical protein